MELNGSYTFDAPREAVWDSIMEPEVLAKVLPGCEHLERVSETEYKGTLNVRVGPVQGRFNGTVVLSNIVEPESFHMAVDGKGSAGFVKGGGDAILTVEGEQILLDYTGEAQVGGRIAGVGQRLLDTSARSIVRQSLESLDRLIKARLEAEEKAQVEADRLAAAEAAAELEKLKTAAQADSLAAAETVAELEELKIAAEADRLAAAEAAAELEKLKASAVAEAQAKAEEEIVESLKEWDSDLVLDFEPPSQAELALGLAKDIYEEYIPEDKRPYVIGTAAGVAALVSIILSILLIRKLFCRC